MKAFPRSFFGNFKDVFLMSLFLSLSFNLSGNSLPQEVKEDFRFPEVKILKEKSNRLPLPNEEVTSKSQELQELLAQIKELRRKYDLSDPVRIDSKGDFPSSKNSDNTSALNKNRTLSIEKKISKQKLHHLVICWLKDSGNEKHRRKIIEITESFRDIPGVLYAESGRVVSSDRSIVDDSFDVGMLIVTKDEADLQKYLDHPIHQKAKKDILLPLVDKILVFDFIK